MVAPTPNYREAGQLLCAYGKRLGMEGDDDGAQQTLASAMDIAKHEGDLTLEMVTLINAAWVDLFHLRLQESGEKSLRAVELMNRLGDPLLGNEGLFHVSRDYYNLGDLVESRRYATRRLAMMERFGDPVLLASSLYLKGKIAALGGDWTNVRQLCDRGLVEVPQHAFHLQTRALMEYTVGDFEQGEAFLERLIEVYRTTRPQSGSAWIHVAVLHTVAVAAHITGVPKHFDVAHSAAQTVLASETVSPLWDWYVRTGLALIAAQSGDTATVQEHYSVLRHKRGIHMTMDVDRLLGILAAASEEWDEAAAHFEAALVTWSKGRYPEYAWTAYEYAELLSRRGNPEGRDKASSLLDKALALSRELGMVPLTEKLLSRQDSLNVQ